MDDKLKNIFSVVLNLSIDDINNDFTPNDTDKWDSMSHLNLISLAEEEFGIDIDPNKIFEMFKSYGIFRHEIFMLLEK